SGSLPNGFSLNPNTGVISGTPTTEGTSNFTIKVTDVNARTDNQSLSIVVDSFYSNTILNTSGLVSYWQMNSGFVSGADVLDSKGTNHGTKTGATLTTSDFVDGGGAGSFDGNDYVTTTRMQSTLESATQYTMELWFKPVALDVSAGLVSKGSGAADSRLSILTFTDGNMYWTPDYIDSNRGYLDYSLYISAGTWNQLVMVFNGGGTGNSERLQSYINGVQRTLTYLGTIPSVTGINTSTFDIGHYFTYYFNGTIDEVAIYNRALTGAEILEHCNAAGKITCGQ
ncbi:putative Ig domain-containing protein, partial [bacterium]|nr:putative Ig domain-containing protein [bacterium]